MKVNIKKRGLIRTVSSLFAASLASGTLCSCGKDFSQVKNLGDQWKVIDQTASIIGADFYQSCLRAAQYPAESRLFGEGPRYFDTVNKRRAEYDLKYPPAQKDIRGVFAVYTGYLQKLSTLADKKTGSITTKQSDDLKSAINGLLSQLKVTGVTVPDIVSNNVGVGTKIVESIFRFIGDGIRQKAILPTIVCTNDEIDTYTKGLIGISSGVYINQLRIERGDFESHIANFTPAIFAPTADGSPKGRLTTQQSRDLLAMENLVIVKDTELRDREAVAKQFSAVISETAKLHDGLSLLFAKELSLIDTSGRIDEAQRDSFCVTYENKAAEDALKASDIPDLKISSKMALEVSEMMKNYQKKTDPLIATIVSSQFYQESVK